MISVELPENQDIPADFLWKQNLFGLDFCLALTSRFNPWIKNRIIKLQKGLDSCTARI
jgi:hypothetical protein